jgi:hypothetical protein
MSQQLTSYKLEKYQRKLQSVSQNHPSYQVYLSKYMYYLQGGGIERIVIALQQYNALTPPPEPVSSGAKFAFNAKKMAKIAQIKALLNTHGCMIVSLSHDKIINLISFGAALTLENIQTTLGCTSLGQKTTGAVQATSSVAGKAVNKGREVVGNVTGYLQKNVAEPFRAAANPPSNPGN